MIYFGDFFMRKTLCFFSLFCHFFHFFVVCYIFSPASLSVPSMFEYYLILIGSKMLVFVVVVNKLPPHHEKYKRKKYKTTKMIEIRRKTNQVYALLLNISVLDDIQGVSLTKESFLNKSFHKQVMSFWWKFIKNWTI